ncbi:MAG: phosphatidylserine decarboxylase [Desulfomonilaceae bacterium]|nr:phosphatidylserine decarboxylase [Desulfomonilaceae bacterium]
MRIRHQFIERNTGDVRDESLLGDGAVNLLYSVAWEKAPSLFRALTGSRASDLLALLCFDNPLDKLSRIIPADSSLDVSECVEPPHFYNTKRKIFQRQIRYWECRPMSPLRGEVVSPADSRVIVGSFRETSALFLKEKFFSFEELVGRDRQCWISAFEDGDFAVFRLTPDKYHYNHTPVSGEVIDVYEISGAYHSCNPGATVRVVTPLSKNRRIVTVMDTDVPNGSGVGLVAMIEVVALMIGDIVQVYSEHAYDDPTPVTKGMFLKKGLPKSLYRPGSSTDVLLFQKGRIRFAEDLVRNLVRSGIRSRYSAGFGRTLVETELQVRSPIAAAVDTCKSCRERRSICLKGSEPMCACFEDASHQAVSPPGTETGKWESDNCMKWSAQSRRNECLG